MTVRAIDLEPDGQAVPGQTNGDADARQAGSAGRNGVLREEQVTDLFPRDREHRPLRDQRRGAGRRRKEQRIEAAVQHDPGGR